MQATGTAAASAKAVLGGLAEAAKAAGRDMTILGTTATQQAEALVKLALAGRKAADALRTELPEAISKLAGPELESFRVAMTQALGQAVDQAKRLAEELGTGSTKGVIALGRAEQASRLLATTLEAVGAQAATSLGVDVATASAKVSAEFVLANQSLATLINSLPALKRAGVDTATVVAQALAKMIDGTKNQAELDAIRDRIKALGVTGQISGQQMAGAFDLSKDKALELKKALEDATPGVQSLGEAARKAGIEAGLLTTGLRKGFEDGIKPVQDLVDQVIKTGVEAAKASPVLAEALNKQIEAAKTKEEMALVVAVINKARDAGYDFGGALSGSLDNAKKKAAELIPEMQMLQAWAQKLGIELAGITGAKPSASLTNPDGSQKGPNDPAESLSGDPDAKFGKQQGPITGTYDIGALGALQLKQRAGKLSASDLGTVDAGISATQYNIEQVQNAGRSNPGVIGLNTYASLASQLKLLQDLKVAIEALGQASQSGVIAGAPLVVGPAAEASIAASQKSANTPATVAGPYSVYVDLGGGRSAQIGMSAPLEANKLAALLAQIKADMARASGG